MNVNAEIAIILRPKPTLRPSAIIGSAVTGPIGVVMLGELSDPYLSVQSCDPAALIAFAEACTEAARQLQQLRTPRAVSA